MSFPLCSIRKTLLALLSVFFLLPASASAAPVISGITHASSASLLYTITGTGFAKGAKLLIGGSAPVSTWQGGTTFIVFQPPKGKTGTVDVQVTNPDGGKVVKKGGFTYPSSAIVPVIRGVAPNQNSTTLKTVWGSNFEKGAKVYVNGVLAPAQWQVGTQYIVFQPPQGTPSGTNVVKVSNPSGGSASLSGNLTITVTATYGYQTPASYAYQTPAAVYAYQTPTAYTTPYSSTDGFPMLPAGQTNVCGGTRDITKMFFASNSIWNTPIGSGAQFGPAYIHPIPDQSELETVNGQLLFDPAKDGNSQPFTNIDETEFSPVILQMDPSLPMTDVKYNGNGPAGDGMGGEADTCVAQEPQTNFQIPWPAQDFIPTHAISRSDGHTAVISADGHRLTEFAYITRCEAQGYITSNQRAPDSDDICADGRYGTHGASGMDAEGGLLRTGELTPTLGAPKHVLAINLREYWMRHITDPDGDGVSHVEERVWPALLGAGSGGVFSEFYVYGVGNPHGYDTDVRQGSLVAIPPTVDINNMGLYTEPGKMLAWTLQNYGAYVTDTGGGALGFYGEAGPDVFQGNTMGFLAAFGAAWHMPFRAVVGWTKQYGNGTFPFGDDINTIGRALRVVVNNGPNSVGGGGDPRVPRTPN